MNAHRYLPGMIAVLLFGASWSMARPRRSPRRLRQSPPRHLQRLPLPERVRLRRPARARRAKPARRPPARQGRRHPVRRRVRRRRRAGRRVRQLQGALIRPALVRHIVRRPGHMVPRREALREERSPATGAEGVNRMEAIPLTPPTAAPCGRALTVNAPTFTTPSAAWIFTTG
jgi:hypothetical protein